MDHLVKLLRPLKGFIKEIVVTEKVWKYLIYEINTKDIMYDGNPDGEEHDYNGTLSILGIRIKKEG